jgi:hypothetical protein
LTAGRFNQHSTFVLDVCGEFTNVNNSTTWSSNMGYITPTTLAAGTPSERVVQRLRVPLVNTGVNNIEVTASNGNRSGKLNFSLTVEARDLRQPQATPVRNGEFAGPAQAGTPWNSAPVVTDVFFEDFADGFCTDTWWSIDDGNSWPIGDWNSMGGTDSVFYSTDAEKTRAFGTETDGILVLASQGRYNNPSVQLPAGAHHNGAMRIGSGVVTRESFGPGFFEVRMKPVPRIGPCSAVWTFWDGRTTSGDPHGRFLYSEIDIEFPGMGASNRTWWGTSYDNWGNEGAVVNKDSFTVEAPGGWNDGQWRTYAFEWRTNDATDDRAIVWYVDEGDGYVEIGHVATAVPDYTAPFWIGNWFPTDLQWVGLAEFDLAYMYIDWVRITQYADPVIAKPSTLPPHILNPIGPDHPGVQAINLGSNPIPVNNYVSNSRFLSGARDPDTGNILASPMSIMAWATASGQATRVSGGGVELMSGTRLTQNINGQTSGFNFRLNVDGEVTIGTGNLRVFVEYMLGPNVLGRSESVLISGTDKSGSVDFTVVDGRMYTLDGNEFNEETRSIRIVVETDNGTAAVVNSLSIVMR